MVVVVIQSTEDRYFWDIHDRRLSILRVHQENQDIYIMGSEGQCKGGN